MTQKDRNNLKNMIKMQKIFRNKKNEFNIAD